LVPPARWTCARAETQQKALEQHWVFHHFYNYVVLFGRVLNINPRGLNDGNQPSLVMSKWGKANPAILDGTFPGWHMVAGAFRK